MEIMLALTDLMSAVREGERQIGIDGK